MAAEPQSTTINAVAQTFRLLRKSIMAINSCVILISCLCPIYLLGCERCGDVVASESVVLRIRPTRNLELHVLAALALPFSLVSSVSRIHCWPITRFTLRQ